MYLWPEARNYCMQILKHQVKHPNYLAKDPRSGEACPPQHSSYTLSLSICLRMKSCGHLVVNLQQLTESRVELASRARVLVTDVLHNIKHCPPCRLNKNRNTSPSGLLQPLPVPLKAQENVRMVLVICLPPNAAVHTCYDGPH